MAPVSGTVRNGLEVNHPIPRNPPAPVPFPPLPRMGMASGGSLRMAQLSLSQPAGFHWFQCFHARLSPVQYNIMDITFVGFSGRRNARGENETAGRGRKVFGEKRPDGAYRDCDARRSMRNNAATVGTGATRRLAPGTGTSAGVLQRTPRPWRQGACPPASGRRKGKAGLFAGGAWWPAGAGAEFKGGTQYPGSAGGGAAGITY